MRKLLLVLTACLCVLSTWADGPYRNHRFDSFKVLAPAEGSILFIGNSITDMHCWPEVFVTSEGDYLPIVNRGNSGTYSTEQSDNLESYLQNKPKKVFMMIGTNDLATSGGLNFSGEQILAYVKSMVERIHMRAPEAKVYLYSILNNKTGNRVEATWLHANEVIKAYADATEGVTYIDLYDNLIDVANGGVWSYDNLHLTAASYQVWAEAICPYLQEGEEYTVKSVYPSNTAEKQNNGNLGPTHGMRATYLSMMPISTKDVLVFGDEFMRSGEWQELLGNLNVKNRATGWGYGGDIATTSKIVDATYADTGVEKQNAKAIFLYSGTGDANGSEDIETVKTAYKALVDKLVEKSPASIIYLMGLCPINDATKNTGRIAVLNEYIKTLVGEKIKYVDTYTPFLDGDVANTTYFYPNNYLGGIGYVKMANIMAETLKADFPTDTYNVISVEEATQRRTQAGLRNSISQAIAKGLMAEIGTSVGQYSSDKMEAFNEEVTKANTLLTQASITEDEATQQITKLNEAILPALNMPQGSDGESVYWYQITSLRAGDRYVTAEGEAGGVVGSNESSPYGTSMWKFVDRGDGTFDIVNREYGGYMNPVVNYNAQVQTVKAQPASGWTVSYANTPGYYIISSGEVQLNQTGDPQNYAIYNWSDTNNKGADRADQGCQLKIQVAPDPEPLPDPSLKTLTLLPAQFANGASTWSYHGTTTSGAWYGKFVTGTTPALTAESTDQSANNMGWASNQPWLKAGYTYNLSLPAGYEIVGYDLTTKSVLDYTGTFTYNTATGTSTSEAQNATEKTVSVNDLSTSAITLTVGSAVDGNKGILITKLVIRYKVVETGDDGDDTAATLTYTVDKANGDLYRGTSANQAWNSMWKSTLTPQLQFGCGANNMNWVDNTLQLMTGTAGSSTYTLTAPSGYVIEDYTFTFANNNHSTGLTLTMNGGKEYTTSTTGQTISAQKQKLYTVSFTLAGNNGQGVLLTDFTVKIKQDIQEKPQMSTENDVHWYYIVSAASNAYCAGKVMYHDAESSKLRFADKAFEASYVWSFWEQDGKIAIKNYKGEYFGTPGGGTGGGTVFGVVDTPNYIYTINDAYGFFTIKDTGVELHAQEAGQVIVRWGAAEGNASLWKFEEVDVSNAAATIAGSTVQQGKVTTGIGNKNQPIVRATLRVSGLEGEVDFKGVKGTFSGTDVKDITNVKAYFATNSRELFIDTDDNKMDWREENAVPFGEAVTLNEDKTFTITGSKSLAPGAHYLWITYDIAETAKEGNTVDASISSYIVGDTEVAETGGNPTHEVTIFLSEGAVLMPMDKGSLYYRIPSITVTKDGKRLVTLTDDRKQHGADLPSHCYLVAQYSEDNGKTWSEPVTVAGTADKGGNYGHGDASIVTNRDNGEIVGIMTSAGTYGHGFFAGTAAEPPRWKTITSRDGGLTWEDPVDHTDDLFGANCDNEKTKTWKSGFSGSGAALQKRDGTLVSSFVNRQDDNSQHFYFFMSKDGGQSWYVSGNSGTDGADEPKTLERNNGDLAISVRSSGYNYYNYTSDDGETWHLPARTRFTNGISGNACDGEYMVWCSTLEGNPWNVAFQTLPNSSSRQNVSIALSTDEGANFGTPKTICPRGSAYSAAVVLPDGTLGVYYEENGLFGGYTMRFVRFSLEWASSGQFKFTEENPFYPIKSTKETGIDEIISSPEVQEDGVMYDLQGRRISEPTANGIYIQNGKKIFVNK